MIVDLREIYAIIADDAAAVRVQSLTSLQSRGTGLTIHHDRTVLQWGSPVRSSLSRSYLSSCND